MYCWFVRHFSLFCGVKDLCSYQTVQLTRPQYAQLAYPFKPIQFTNSAPLIPPSEAYQRPSKIAHNASETFTQRWRRWIGAGSRHPNRSVNGATNKLGAWSRIVFTQLDVIKCVLVILQLLTSFWDWSWVGRLKQVITFHPAINSVLVWPCCPSFDECLCAAEELRAIHKMGPITAS